MSELEMCCVCGEPTGRAGMADDSIYCGACDRGPFCSTCFLYHDYEHIHAKLTRAEALAEAMNELKIQASVTKVELRNDDSKTAKILRGLIAQWQNMIDTALAAYREETSGHIAYATEKTVASLERELAEWRRKYEARKGTCSWNLISEDEDIWETGCGNAWYLTEGNVEENGMKYCPFCGGKLESNNA